MTDWKFRASEVQVKLEELAIYSEVKNALARPTLSRSHKKALDQIRIWMQEAGMAVEKDHAGNLIGRLESKRENAPTFLMGSHIDTVSNAGIYDGNLGIIAAISAVDLLETSSSAIPFNIDVIAFSDEEGNRFPNTLTGSQAVAGTLNPNALTVSDSEGITRAEALTSFGCDPALACSSLYLDERPLGYLEIHIEQGPVLEREDLSVGIVTAINGARRFTVKVGGNAGHAGTVPMSMRSDALAASAEMLMAIESIAKSGSGMVATVGMLEVIPGARNVIPGQVKFSLDLRGENSGSIDAAQASIFSEISNIASTRQVQIEWNQDYKIPPTFCDSSLGELLGESIRESGVMPFELTSGAGHDAVAIADLCPVAMLFVRCKKGISHHPSEAVKIDDIAKALEVTHYFLRKFGQTV